MTPTLYLFDDQVARDWEPFALTRPAGELLFGVLTLRARVERALSLRCTAQIAAEHLIGFEEEGAPPVVSPGSLSTEEPRLFLLSRFVPGPAAARDWKLETRPLSITAPTGETIGWYCPAGSPPPDESAFLDPDSTAPGETITPDGVLLRHVWQLVSENPDQISRDIEWLRPTAKFSENASIFRWGPHPLFVDPTATVEPGSAFDTSAGPVWLDRRTHVRSFSRIAGPAYLGDGSTILGGPVEATSIGPVCRVRGELAESVCLGYVNKQHDGHIGHAYLGRWVNLGAETTNSDLKNNYGTIRLWTPHGEVDTREIKLGSLIGDHVKTGIGLLLNTGTVIGAGTNLFGSLMPPTFVTPFSWGSGSDLVEYRLDKFLAVAQMAMSRRGVELTESAKEQLARSWHRGRQQPPGT
jgi:UDP-N-acetylglucosamine diphosphorylase/glucosamine-1-phosphate N-acetyltransferase